MPPKNIIINEYISHSLPIKWDQIPTNPTNKTRVKHILNGELELNILNPTTKISILRSQIRQLVYNHYVIMFSD